MANSIKKFDDRPRILWKCSLTESEELIECRMKNIPLEFFICTQVETCKYQCIQKIEQRQRQEYVHEQQLKLLTKIENISQYNGNNGGRKQS